MRLAFGKEPAQGRKMGDPMQRMRLVQKTRRAQIGRLDEVKPEMLVEPRPPGCAHGVSGLQDAAQSRPRSATYQSEVTPMRSRHQFENDAGLPVALDAEYDAFVDPFHGAYLHNSCVRTRHPGRAALLFVWKFQAHRAVAFRIVHPTFPHLDVKKKMHGLLNRRGDLGARRSADRLDGLPAFAERDLALAVAGDIDSLLNAHRTVLELL